MNWNKSIFIAHVSEDKPFVRNLYNNLKNNGLEPWIDDRNLDPGVKWEYQIKQAIHKSRFFIACISKKSVTKNGYFHHELCMALNVLSEKPKSLTYFIPALLEDKIELPKISIGSINFEDYQTIKIFTQDGIIKLVSYLWQEINIINLKMKKNLDKIRILVKKNKLDQSLDVLQKYIDDNDRDLKNSIILLCSRFNDFKNKNLRGILSQSSYILEINKIKSIILEYVNQLENLK